MFAASGNESLDVLLEFLKFGAGVEDRDEDGMTPLMNAASGNANPSIAAALIAAGAKVDDRDGHGRTSLMFAARDNPKREVIDTLLKAGARIDDKDKNGVTPLDVCRHQHVEPGYRHDAPGRRGENRCQGRQRDHTTDVCGIP